MEKHTAENVTWKCELCGNLEVINANRFMNQCQKCGETLIPLPFPDFHIREYGATANGAPEFYAIALGDKDIANLGKNGEYAALLSASPKLLWSLKQLLGMVLRLESYENFGRIGKEKIDNARAAIAAAEGGGGMKMEKELDKIAENITNLTACMINILTMDVKSDFPYKAQYVLEKVIKRLGERV